MDFMDEEVVKLRQKARDSKSSLQTGYYIDGKLIEFEEALLFDEKMSVLLPKEFVDMPLKLAKLKYPSEQRPQIIKTNLMTTVNFGFNLFDKPIKPSQIESAAASMKTMIKKVNPAIIFYEFKCETIGTQSLSWFDFKGYGVDSQIYYIDYITSIGGKVQHGIFNCTFADRGKWKETALQVFRSIRDLTVEV